MKSKMAIKSTRPKGRVRAVVPPAKKLRSRLPRRRRVLYSPILCKSQNLIGKGNAKIVVCAKPQVDSLCFSRFPAESSCNSTGFSVISSNLKVIPQRKRIIDDTGDSEASNRHDNCDNLEHQFRKSTRKLHREKKQKHLRIGDVRDVEVEASESSCVESSSVAFGNQRPKVKGDLTAAYRAENVEKLSLIEDSDAISRSEISSISRQCSRDKLQLDRAVNDFIGKRGADEVLVFKSGLKFVAKPKFHNTCSSISKLLSSDTASGDIESRESRPTDEILPDCVASTSTAPDLNLFCAEQLSFDEVPDYTSSLDTTFSKIFPEIAESNFDEYSPSMWDDSIGQSSEGEVSESSPENPTPSPTFSLFLQFSEQFSRLSFPNPSGASSRNEEEYQDEFRLLRFRDEDDEESYRRFRNRERRHVSVHNYAEHHRCVTEYGDLVAQLRLQMVHWIVEQSATKKLQRETLFLAVNLLDRFLSKGFFKTKRTLEIVAIACLTLATRIEENQPHNSVREKFFYIGDNMYSRCEVVAMEWLVQKILNYQCFLPTIYNFLWFYLKAARANAEMEKRAKYLAVLALLDQELLRYWPSTVAAGVVILASLAANQDKSCLWVMETHVRTKDDDLSDCIKSLEWLVKYVY